MAIKYENIFAESWAESLALLFVIMGFILSVLLTNPTFSYITVALSGFIAGRIFYIKHYKEPIFPFILAIIGFLLGYLLGGFWINRVAVLIFFIAATWLSYYLHTKKILVIFKSQGFVK